MVTLSGVDPGYSGQPCRDLGSYTPLPSCVLAKSPLYLQASVWSSEVRRPRRSLGMGVCAC